MSAESLREAARGLVEYEKTWSQCPVCGELLDRPDNDMGDGEWLGHTDDCPVALLIDAPAQEDDCDDGVEAEGESTRRLNDEARMHEKLRRGEFTFSIPRGIASDGSARIFGASAQLGSAHEHVVFRQPLSGDDLVEDRTFRIVVEYSAIPLEEVPEAPEGDSPWSVFDEFYPWYRGLGNTKSPEKRLMNMLREAWRAGARRGAVAAMGGNYPRGFDACVEDMLRGTLPEARVAPSTMGESVLGPIWTTLRHACAAAFREGVSQGHRPDARIFCECGRPYTVPADAPSKCEACDTNPEWTVVRTTEYAHGGTAKESRDVFKPIRRADCMAGPIKLSLEDANAFTWNPDNELTTSSEQPTDE